jgi:hypothetical protein
MSTGEYIFVQGTAIRVGNRIPNPNAADVASCLRTEEWRESKLFEQVSKIDAKLLH